MVDQLLEILENTDGIYGAFVLNKDNELTTINEDKFNDDEKQAELLQTLLTVIVTLREFQSLNISKCSFEYQKHRCDVFLSDDLSLSIIYNNIEEFEKIEPIIKEILESI